MTTGSNPPGNPPGLPGSELACNECGGDHDYVFMHSKCHIKSATWMKMHKTGRMELICAKCGKTIIADLLVYLTHGSRNN